MSSGLTVSVDTSVPCRNYLKIHRYLLPHCPKRHESFVGGINRGE